MVKSDRVTQPLDLKKNSQQCRSDRQGQYQWRTGTECDRIPGPSTLALNFLQKLFPREYKIQNIRSVIPFLNSDANDFKRGKVF